VLREQHTRLALDENVSGFCGLEEWTDEDDRNTDPETGVNDLDDLGAVVKVAGDPVSRLDTGLQGSSNPSHAVLELTIGELGISAGDRDIVRERSCRLD
jgi:hypothetical protein